jgi:hypothetical protein
MFVDDSEFPNFDAPSLLIVIVLVLVLVIAPALTANPSQAPIQKRLPDAPTPLRRHAPTLLQGATATHWAKKSLMLYTGVFFT